MKDPGAFVGRVLDRVEKETTFKATLYRSFMLGLIVRRPKDFDSFVRVMVEEAAKEGIHG